MDPQYPRTTHQEFKDRTYWIIELIMSKCEGTLTVNQLSPSSYGGKEHILQGYWCPCPATSLKSMQKFRGIIYVVSELIGFR